MFGKQSVAERDRRSEFDVPGHQESGRLLERNHTEERREFPS